MTHLTNWSNWLTSCLTWLTDLTWLTWLTGLIDCLIMQVVAGRRVQVSARTVRRWVRQYEMDEEIRISKWGKHSKTTSIVNNSEFRVELTNYVRENSIRKGKLKYSYVRELIFNYQGSANMTGDDIRNWINTRLGLSDENGYSLKTVHRWLHMLGFQVSNDILSYYWWIELYYLGVDFNQKFLITISLYF